MKRKATYAILFVLVGLCSTVFIYVKLLNSDQSTEMEHFPNELEFPKNADEGRKGSTSLREEAVPNASVGNSGKRSEESKTSRVVARMPAGYQPDQLHLRRELEVNNKTVRSPKHAVDVVTGLTEASNAERFRAVSDLHGAELPEAEATRLLDYLADEHRYKGMSNAAMYVLINEIVAVFHDQPVLSDDYLEVSAQVINDKTQQENVRDYTLQGLSRGMVNASETQAKMIKNVFWDSLDETDTSLPGTALLALNRERRAGKLSAEDVAKLEKTVAEFIENPNLGERTRIPAIQVADDMEITGLSDSLARIAESKNTFSERIVIESIRSK
ncbi:hypothetical protein DDZ13_00220 [Coraliomargarita sinensis]|uniref:Uncharacterized protein n=1 Tax=Coraliomargarita sinensis TaxID=2174842 RepID=A0A317ZI93_9BACT|nr:hypothetical protein [Coraliomargarita sinensis]PXA05325.1 hypothetical protein DDZ13_00220 [Coraliomargarita sinensis]